MRLFSPMSPHQSADKSSQVSEIQLTAILRAMQEVCVMSGMCGHVQYGLHVYFQKEKCISVASVLLNIDFLSAALEERNLPGKISSWGFAWQFYGWSTILGLLGVLLSYLGQRCLLKCLFVPGRSVALTKYKG